MSATATVVPGAPFSFDEKDPAQAALKLQKERAWALNLEPKTVCVEHGPQNGPSCPDCWVAYGPKGRPLTDEEKAGRPASTEELQAQIDELKSALAQSAAANAEFQAWKAEQQAAQAKAVADAAAAEQGQQQGQ